MHDYAGRAAQLSDVGAEGRAGAPAGIMVSNVGTKSHL
jgi:hypothetical protein